MEALMLVMTRGGPTMFARIGVMRALNRHVERVFDSSRKDCDSASPERTRRVYLNIVLTACQNDRPSRR